MTLTSLSVQHRAALAMLSTLLEQNRVYFQAFGYPTGKTCPHCNKEVFADAEVIDQLAKVPGSGLAHDYCHEIARLNAELTNGPKITLVQMPNPKDQGDEGDPANPDEEPIPQPAPAPIPEPADEPAKEDARASA